MSGVYIKGMEMPTDCNHCRFAVDGWCYAYGKPNVDALANDGVTNWCPLIAVKDDVYIVKDGVLYKITPKIQMPFSKRVNVMTGEVYYPSNADRIRQMTDEEQAEYIDQHTAEAMWCESPPKDCPPHEECMKCILDWLKQEVTE